VEERPVTAGSVKVPLGVEVQRKITVSRVKATDGVGEQCASTARGIVVAGRVFS
jgi:hypothetical protein